MKRGSKRKFKGETFQYYTYSYGKDGAVNIAKDLRFRGYKARVVPMKDVWYIYIRKGDKKTNFLLEHEEQALKKLTKHPYDVEYGAYLDINENGLERASITKGKYGEWQPHKKISDDYEVQIHTHPGSSWVNAPSYSDIMNAVSNWKHNDKRKDYILLANGKVIEIYIKDKKKFSTWSYSQMKNIAEDTVFKRAKKEYVLTNDTVVAQLEMKYEKQGLSKREIKKKIKKTNLTRLRTKKEKLAYNALLRHGLEKELGISFKYVDLKGEKIKVVEPKKRSKKRK